MTAKADDVKLPTVVDLVIAQNKDAFWNQMKQIVGTPNCLYTFDKSGLHVR